MFATKIVLKRQEAWLAGSRSRHIEMQLPGVSSLLFHSHSPNVNMSLTELWQRERERAHWFASFPIGLLPQSSSRQHWNRDWYFFLGGQTERSRFTCTTVSAAIEMYCAGSRIYGYWPTHASHPRIYAADSILSLSINLGLEKWEEEEIDVRSYAGNAK